MPEESVFWLDGSAWNAASTHHSSKLPSRPLSTHTPWSGRGSWRPGGARHCTNDLDAMGRVCSALPGSTVDGMGALPAATYERAADSGAPCPWCRSAPAGGIVFDPRPGAGSRPFCPRRARALNP